MAKSQEEKDELKVKHPTLGHVIFYNPTNRERDVIYDYADVKRKLNQLMPEGAALFYKSDDYMFIKKDGDGGGTHDSHFHLMDIAIRAMETGDAPVLLHKKDFVKVMDSYIARIRQVIKEYPER